LIYKEISSVDRMDQVNSQRENGPTERENGTKPGYGGQQFKTEKSFISRGFGREAAVGETVVASAVGGGTGTVVEPSLCGISMS
jgi:hypothetical protein